MGKRGMGLNNVGIQILHFEEKAPQSTKEEIQLGNFNTRSWNQNRTLESPSYPVTVFLVFRQVILGSPAKLPTMPSKDLHCVHPWISLAPATAAPQLAAHGMKKFTGHEALPPPLFIISLLVGDHSDPPIPCLAGTPGLLP